MELQQENFPDPDGELKMKSYSIGAVMRRELEKVLPKNLTAEQIKILDQTENLFKQAYQAGFNEARLVGGEE